MSSYRVEQRRVSHRGREFRFISYEGRAGDVARQTPPTPPMWFLVDAGKRWPALPQHEGQELDELDRLLADWLETNVFA